MISLYAAPDLFMRPNAERIICIVNKEFDTDVRAKTRRRDVSLPRLIAVHFIKQHTGASNEDIAAMFGYKNHSAVTYAGGVVADLLHTRDRVYYKKITKLEDMLNTLSRINVI